MEIILKDKIRELRQAKKITQEQLASHLGISGQSVGKWERGEGYPDITLLPAIALYFDVTLDELLGVDRERVDQRVGEYIRKSRKLLSEGKAREDQNLWEEAYKEFPNNETVNVKLMYSLISENSSDDQKLKAVKIGENLLNNSTNSQHRYSAIQAICFANHYLGNEEKAKEYAKMAGSYDITQSELLAIILDGEEKAVQCQSNILALADIITRNIYILICCGGYSRQQKISMFNTCINIYKLIFENGDYGFYSTRISEYYRYIAYHQAKLGNKEECLESIEQMAEFAIEFDTQQSFDRTSLLVNRTKHISGNFSKNHTENDTRICLLHLQKTPYDFVRNETRFLDVIAELEKHAN